MTARDVINILKAAYGRAFYNCQALPEDDSEKRIFDGVVRRPELFVDWPPGYLTLTDPLPVAEPPQKKKKKKPAAKKEEKHPPPPPPPLKKAVEVQDRKRKGPPPPHLDPDYEDSPEVLSNKAIDRCMWIAFWASRINAWKAEGGEDPWARIERLRTPLLSDWAKFGPEVLKKAKMTLLVHAFGTTPLVKGPKT